MEGTDVRIQETIDKGFGLRAGGLTHGGYFAAFLRGDEYLDDWDTYSYGHTLSESIENAHKRVLWRLSGNDDDWDETIYDPSDFRKD